MKLQYLPFKALHFPASEWTWLRKPVPFESAPDFFLWAAPIARSDRLWAWHPLGGGVTGAVTGADPDQAIPFLVPAGEEISELEAFGLYLKTTFTARAPQEAEWIAALKTLSEHFHHDVARDGLPPYFADAMKAAGLEPHLGALAGRERFRFLDRAELEFLFERRWDPSCLELLESMPAETRRLAVEAIARWNLTAQQSKEICGGIVSVLRKLGEKAARTLLTGNYGSPEEFRATLSRTAQPELFALSEARIQKLRDLKAPPRTSVYSDPSFENDAIKITHTPRGIADIEYFKEWISDPAVLEKFRALFAIYEQ
ncbi:MAG: hypothetical protein HYW49_07520 [Deltaproteobacteria bacterium]|nr:hypothetical protein [Deltaproteobacteria bacterium]